MSVLNCFQSEVNSSRRSCTKKLLMYLNVWIKMIASKYSPKWLDIFLPHTTYSFILSNTGYIPYPTSLVIVDFTSRKAIRHVAFPEMLQPDEQGRANGKSSCLRSREIDQEKRIILDFQNKPQLGKEVRMESPNFH